MQVGICAPAAEDDGSALPVIPDVIEELLQGTVVGSEEEVMHVEVKTGRAQCLVQPPAFSRKPHVHLHMLWSVSTEVDGSSLSGSLA